MKRFGKASCILNVNVYSVNIFDKKIFLETVGTSASKTAIVFSFNRMQFPRFQCIKFRKTTTIFFFFCLEKIAQNNFTSI